MGLTILGLGTCLPGVAVDQAVAAQMAAPMLARNQQEARLIPTLFRRSGVARRTSVLLKENGGDVPEQTFYRDRTGDADLGPTTDDRMKRYAVEAPALAASAAKRSLLQANTIPDQVRHLITVSCTGFAAPGIDMELVRVLGLPASVSRTNVGFMGCHGAFNGLRIAGALAAADPDAHVLVCAVELCSLHFAYGWNPQAIVANALFSDGAAAVVGCATNGNESWCVAAHGSALLPDSADAMTWHIGNHGFEMTLSPRVPDLIKEHLRPWITPWLASHGLGLPGIGSWAVHPGGPRVVSAVADALGIAHDELADSYRVLSECGNMSSPTILFILERLRQRGARLPWVALGFGPGLAIEAMLIR